MKAILKKTPHLVGLLLIILAAFFILRNARDVVVAPNYEVQSPTPQKFRQLARWIPERADLLIVIDTARALSQPLLKEKIRTLSHDQEGTLAEFVEEMTEHQEAIGMMALVGVLGSEGSPPHFALLVQGAFDESTFLPAVRRALAHGKSGLSAEHLGWTTLYAESDVKDPFGFLLLDPEHLALSSAQSLEALFAEKPQQSAFQDDKALADQMIFGSLTIGPRIRSALPESLAIPSCITFSSSDGTTIVAHLQAASPTEAAQLSMFLEGIKSLMMLQQEQNTSLVTLLKGITMQQRGTDVLLTSGLLPLLDLWEQSPTTDQP